MKQGIHPNWHHDCVVTCSCGNTFVTGANTSTLKVDICAACHPFFTGEMKFVDRKGRVEKFMKKRATAQTVKAAIKKKTAQNKQADPTKSYKQILQEQQNIIKNLQVKKTVAADKPAKTNALSAKK